jgi:hypothetical protein
MSSPWLKKFREIEHISAYDYIVNNGDINILFLGSCRMVALCVFIMEYLKFDESHKYGFSIITDYHYKLLNHFESPMNPKIKFIIENADIIVHEPTKNMNYLNTSFNTEINIYNSFSLKLTYKNIKIPHIGALFSISDIRTFSHVKLIRETKLYLDDITKSPDTEQLTIDEIVKLRELNINELLFYVKEYEFPELTKLIENNWKKQRLFSNFSHPLSICFIYLLKDLIPKMFEVKLDPNIENHLLQIDLFNSFGIQSLSEEDYETGISRNIDNYL